MQPIFSSVNGVVLILVITASSNTILSLLISLRLIYYDRNVRRLLGSDEGPHSPYKAALIICVESCTLIIAVSITFIVMYYTTRYAFVIPLALMPYAHVGRLHENLWAVR